MYLGGGGPIGALTPIGMKVTGIVCAAASAFCLVAAMSKGAQEILVAPSRAMNFSPKEFYFVALVAGLLAASRFFYPGLEVAPNAL
jgi:hypothetical protein